MTPRPDPRAAEQSLERKRAALDATLGELQGRVAAGRLAAGALGALGGKAAGQAGAAGGAAHGNPLAVALVGAGLAWLFVARGGDAPPATGDDRRGGETGLPEAERQEAPDTADPAAQPVAGGIGRLVRDHPMIAGLVALAAGAALAAVLPRRADAGRSGPAKDGPAAGGGDA